MQNGTIEVKTNTAGLNASEIKNEKSVTQVVVTIYLKWD